MRKNGDDSPKNKESNVNISVSDEGNKQEELNYEDQTVDNLNTKDKKKDEGEF